MAVDKLVDSTQLNADLTSVANAIRTKGGTSAQLAFPADFLTAIAAIPSGGGGSVQYKSGTYTPTQDYTTDGNRKLTTTEVVGFTPDIFILCIDDKSTVSGTSGAILQSMFAKISSAGNAYRATARYSNTSNTIGGIFDGSNWTSSSAGQLYMNSGTGDIYYHTNQNYKLFSGKNYSWFAFKLPSS